MSFPNLGRLLARPTVRGCTHSACSPFWMNYLPFLGTAEISHVVTRQDKGFHSTVEQFAAKSKNSKKKLVKPMRVNPKAVKLTVVTIHQNMTVRELAATLGRDVDHVFEVLMYVPGGDKYEEENSVIKDFNIIKEVVKKSGMKFQIGSHDQKKKEKENKDFVRQPPPDPAMLVKRPPVVTIMGHVDHGKTTLLDALRDSNIVEQEFGGITQHIGAFSVKLSSGEAITFLDTPGHAAFSAMRARGARVTDIIVLVVAGDDGVMNQTRESVQHAKDANVPVIVAVNKMDKREADLERTKKMLIELQLDLEDIGGDVQVIPISALKGTNLSLLQEAIVTQAELMELRADAKGLVEGRVVESKTDPGRGKLVTAVVQRGTLRRGDLLVAGTSWAKVRGMFNDQGKPIQEAAPSTPVEIIGWKDLPSAGEEILQVPSMEVLKDAVSWREAEQQSRKVEEDQLVIEVKREEHEQLYQEKLQKRRETGRKRARPGPKQKETITQHEGPQLSLILKGDVDGSVEAILDTLDTYHSKLCRLDLVHYGVGNVTESDVQLAEAFRGVIYGFNVSAPAPVVKAARDRSVSIRTHNVIYKLFDDLVSSLSSKLPIVQEEDVLGEAEVKAVFQVTEGRRKVAVAGCRCVRGTLQRKHLFKIIREGDVIYNGELSSMKHFKKEVDVVKTDVECGLSVDAKDVDFQSGDLVVCYQVREVEQEIDWQPGF